MSTTLVPNLPNDTLKTAPAFGPEQAAPAPGRGPAQQQLVDSLYPGRPRTTSEQYASVYKAPDRRDGPALARRPAGLIPREPCGRAGPRHFNDASRLGSRPLLIDRNGPNRCTPVFRATVFPFQMARR